MRITKTPDGVHEGLIRDELNRKAFAKYKGDSDNDMLQNFSDMVFTQQTGQSVINCFDYDKIDASNADLADFLATLDVDAYPDARSYASPTDKAMDIYDHFSKKNKKPNKQLAQEMNQEAANAKFLDSSDGEMMNRMMQDRMNEQQGKEKAEGASKDFVGKTEFQKKLEYMVKMKSAMTLVNVSRVLESYTDTFSPFKTIEIERESGAYNQEIFQNRQFTDYNLISPATLASVGSEDLANYKILKNEFLVQDGAIYKVRKQLLYVILDNSGSMGNYSGPVWRQAIGAVMNRVNAVYKGEAELIFNYFGGDLYSDKYEKEVKTYEQAKALFDELCSNNPNDGTNIDKAVSSTIARIKDRIDKDPSFRAPEILVVTDGCDEVNTSLTDVQFVGGGEHRTIKIHTIVVNTDLNKVANPGLLSIAQATQGVYIQCDSTGKIREDWQSGILQKLHKNKR